MSAPLLIYTLWFLVGIHRTIYYLYLWQIKEYRFDRFVVFLQEPGGCRSVFTRSFIVTSLLFCLSFFLSHGVLLSMLFILYFGEILLWGRSVVRQEPSYPVVTPKIVSLFALTIASIGLSFVFLSSSAFFALQRILLLHIALPLFVPLWVLVEKPFIFFAKQYFVLRAVKKRKILGNLIAVGITGSFGKTSTKEWLASILASRFKVIKTENHQNTEVGASKAILAMPSDNQVLVAEMAAYRKEDIAQIASVVRPTIGIITGVGSQHLALFGSQEAIVKTKFELALALPRGGTLIVNGDSPFVRHYVEKQAFQDAIAREDKTFIVYSCERQADIYASDIHESLEGLTFSVHAALPGIQETTETMRTNLLGRHVISNLLGATACALFLGMKIEEIAKAVASLTPFPQTLEPKRGINGSLIIDDTYNASFEGVMAGLRVLSLAKGKKIVILTSLIELGKKAKLTHKRLGEALATVADRIVVTDMKYHEELASKKTSFLTDPHNIVDEIGGNRLGLSDVILLEGRIPSEIVRQLFRA